MTMIVVDCGFFVVIVAVLAAWVVTKSDGV